MEEKQPGQQPEADRASGALQGGTARDGGRAKGGLAPTDRDRELVEEADRAGKASTAALRDGGFGDHKGVEGFPALDRDD